MKFYCIKSYRTSMWLKNILKVLFIEQELLLYLMTQNGRTIENNAQESNPINTNVRVYDCIVILQIKAWK